VHRTDPYIEGDVLQRFVAELSRQGVPLLAGTDSPLMPGLVPGIGLNEELRMLKGSGLSSFQALAAATRTPGEFITRYVPGAARFGIVESGARADLLLVAQNPLESLDTLRKPLGVMSAGRWRTADELQALLQENRRNLEAQTREIFRVR
jgi:imidazolonepropionase-like amidohydrolase